MNTLLPPGPRFGTLLQPRSDLEFCCWIGEASPGEALTYYRGFLAIDACKVRSQLTPADCAHLKALAETARAAFDAGLVHLVQRRLGPDRFAYIGICRPKPLVRRKALDTLLNDRRVV